ncbi:unnamed protein product [Triticum turgidum subsp. durum]|uniref:Uncharacterized protein n=1 Tax=Triticum turgidum subsp. durum TaxID=4567 RepID=A0A9R1S825_TRITD|nr:unnamed protein product [Triticum turgidum subsp. durum]
MVAEGYLLQMSIISHMETQRYVPLLFLLQDPKKGMHKAKPSLTMAPSTVLIGAFRLYSLGHPMEVRRKNRDQLRAKGKFPVGLVK